MLGENCRERLLRGTGAGLSGLSHAHVRVKRWARCSLKLVEAVAAVAVFAFPIRVRVQVEAIADINKRKKIK